jgi:hypothetical protein
VLACHAKSRGFESHFSRQNKHTILLLPLLPFGWIFQKDKKTKRNTPSFPPPKDLLSCLFFLVSSFFDIFVPLSRESNRQREQQTKRKTGFLGGMSQGRKNATPSLSREKENAIRKKEPIRTHFELEACIFFSVCLPRKEDKLFSSSQKGLS